MDPDPGRLGAEGEPLAPRDSAPRDLARREFTIRRAFGLPRAIVWDALVDPVLVPGWLGDLDVDLRMDGHYRLNYSAPVGRQPQSLSDARIREVTEPTVLDLEMGESGRRDWTRVRFELEDVPGGPRNRSTVLRLAVASSDPDPDINHIRAAWLLHLDQLDELVHGRPVDPTCWTDVQDEVWLDYVAGPSPSER